MALDENCKAAAEAADGSSRDALLDRDHNHYNTVEGEPVKLPYPKSIFFIISNEFCERFNYFGMRTIQALYFTQKLGFDKHTATILYHSFTTLVFFMCIFGAIISDSWLGKYKTILYLSLVYALGSAIVAISAIPTLNLPTITFTAIGLLLIAIGSGGIKPCVAAFGGDQFQLPAQLAQMASYFSVFYFSINSGTIIATFITPILRHDVHCFDENHCYSLALGVPGVLMLISIIVFVSGKRLYKIYPPSGNMLVQVTKCIKNAIVTRSREKEIKPCKNWLDYSEEKYGKELVADTRTLLKVLVLFVPLPLFWSLYEQQGTRWTFQALNMDGDVGFYKIKPDQMHVFSSLLILMFIPLCETVVYPLLAKIGIRRPLQKMSIGMGLAALAFLMSGIVELKVERTYPVQPQEGEAQLRFINGLPCNFTVKTNIPFTEKNDLNQFKLFEVKYIQTVVAKDYEFSLISNEPNCPKKIQGGLKLKSRSSTTVFVSGPKIEVNDTYTDSSQRSQTPMLRVLFSSLTDLPKAPLREIKITTPSSNNRVAFASSSSDRRLHSIISGVHEVNIDGKYYETIELKDGSVSSLIVLETSNEQTKFKIHLVEIAAPNSVSMLWLLPQYTAMILGEVMFSITGLEFSYAQAPASMKSVMQACWLLSIAFGNIVIMSIAGLRIFQSQAHEFFLFSGIMVVDIFLFMILAKNYKSVNPPSSDPKSDADNKSISGFQKLIGRFAFATTYSTSRLNLAVLGITNSHSNQLIGYKNEF